MRAPLTTLIIGLAACAGVDEGPPAARSRQAIFGLADGGAQVKGRSLLARLGTVVTACPGGGYAASAPGDDSVWLSGVQAWLAPPRVLPTFAGTIPLACVGSPTAPRALVGGPSAFSLVADGGTTLVSAQRVDAIDSAPGLFLAISNAVTGTITTFPSNVGTFSSATFTLTPGPGWGSGLAWSEAGWLVVANAQARSVGVYPADTGFDGGVVLVSSFSLANPDPLLTGTDFGAVVATGDFTPDTKEEFLISAPAVGRVYVFSGTANVLLLRGGPSFGAALAFDPRDYGGGLHALWVGEPALDVVHRFVGAEDTVFAAPPSAAGSRFGSALSVDSQGRVVVGAPDYTEGTQLQIGAVFEGEVDAGGLSGVPMHCVVGATCTLPMCTTGTCVGGVFCQRTRAIGSDCSPNEVCNPGLNTCVDGGLDAGRDAGPADAGSTDAGSDAGMSDAGPPDTDAGAQDAGSDAGITVDAGAGADAGPAQADGGAAEPAVVFRTCGCGSGGLPLLLLGLLWARRRGTAAAQLTGSRSNSVLPERK